MVGQLVDIGSAALLGMILACSEHLQNLDNCWKVAQVEMLKKHGFEAFNYKDTRLFVVRLRVKIQLSQQKCFGYLTAPGNSI